MIVIRPHHSTLSPHKSCESCEFDRNEVNTSKYVVPIINSFIGMSFCGITFLVATICIKFYCIHLQISNMYVAIFQRAMN